MADMYDDFVEPAELTGYGRAAADELAENELTLATWLPNQTIGDLRYRVESDPAGLLDAADYRAYDAQPTFGRREGIARIEGTLPPLGRQMTLGEFDQLIARDAEQEVRDLLLRDSARVAAAMARRIELARADALVNSSVSIGSDANPENGLSIKVDFARKAEHTVTAATLWSDPAALILDMLEDWADIYRDSNGVAPGAALTSTKIIRAMLRNSQVRSAIVGDNTTLRPRRSDLDNLLADENLPRLYTNEAQATVPDPTATGGRRTRRMIPEHKFLMLPPPGDPSTEEGGHMGASLWGTTVEARLPDYGIEPGEEPGIVVAAFIERKTPVRVDTVGTAIALPVMVQPNLSFVANVLAP